MKKLLPAGNISHPWEELHEVSAWISSSSETLDEVIDELDVLILLRLDRRLIVNDR